MEITHTRHLEGRDQLGKLCSLKVRNVAWKSSNLVLEVGFGGGKWTFVVCKTLAKAWH